MSFSPLPFSSREQEGAALRKRAPVICGVALLFAALGGVGFAASSQRTAKEQPHGNHAKTLLRQPHEAVGHPGHAGLAVAPNRVHGAGAEEPEQEHPTAAASRGADGEPEAVNQEQHHRWRSDKEEERRKEEEEKEEKEEEEEERKERDAKERAEEAANATANLTQEANKTRNNITQDGDDHDHKDCSGGPAAACECMLKCSVFGASPDQCSGKGHHDKRMLVDKLIRKTMLRHSDMCDGMRCIRNCAKKLGCLDEKVVTDCRIVEKNYEKNRKDSDPSCNLECDS